MGGQRGRMGAYGAICSDMLCGCVTISLRKLSTMYDNYTPMKTATDNKEIKIITSQKRRES